LRTQRACNLKLLFARCVISKQEIKAVLAQGNRVMQHVFNYIK